MNVLNNKTQEDICRACMRNLEGTIYINLEADMITMYTTCTDVKMHVGDGLPQHICKMCLASLNSFMQFRKQCQTSDTLLKQVYTYKEDKTKVVKDEDSGEQQFENNSIESLMDICKKVEWVSDEDNDENTFLTEIVAMDLDETYTPEYKIKKKKKGKKSSLLKNKSKDMNSENNAKDEPDSDYDVNYESDQIFDPFLSDSEENVIATYITKKKKNVRKKSVYRKKSKKVGKGIEDYKCGLCKKNLSTYNKLTKHLETHKDDKACGLCHEASPDWPHLVAHRLNHIDKKVNKCYICDQRLMSVDGMELHIREKHFDGKGILCKICNKQFTSIRYLKKHLNYVHTEANFTCDKCSKTFKTKHNLTYHAQIHNKEKKHVCMECGFTCNFSGGLKAHIYRMHTSDDPQECKICKKPFKNKLSLYEHTRQHRAHCICSECGRTFSSQTLLQRHAMTHRDERPFKCKLCPAQYTSAQTLRDHNYKHEGIRPHQCEFCEASFYTKSVLVKHRRIHTGEKPYVCRVCQKGFTGRSNLKVHMKVHGELLINKKVDAGVECETN